MQVKGGEAPGAHLKAGGGGGGSVGADDCGRALRAPMGVEEGKPPSVGLGEFRSKEIRRPSASEPIKPAKWIHAEKCQLTLKTQEGSSPDLISLEEFKS